MAKITIDFNDLADKALLESLLKKLNEQKASDIKKMMDELNDVSCEIPNAEEKDPATKIAEEQKYTICRFQSIQKLLFDLQNDLTRKDYSMSAGLVRNTMRRLKDAEDSYLTESRHALSKIVNARELFTNTLVK